MRCQLSREFRFEAAHTLPRVPEDHKCRRMHGHSYQVTVTVVGDVDPEMGWLIDFAAIDEAVTPVISELDHRVLNEVAGLDNPTCEVLAAFLWKRVAAQLTVLDEIVVSETPDSRCVFRGEF